VTGGAGAGGGGDGGTGSGGVAGSGGVTCAEASDDDGYAAGVEGAVAARAS
jgi:hypothetical protein